MPIVIRNAAVSGYFYPEKPDELAGQIESFLQNCTLKPVKGNAKKPRALILPHAGYLYSGPIAAAGFSTLLNYADQYDDVVVIGPSHRVDFDGIGLFSGDYFQTPFGNIPINKENNQELVAGFSAQYQNDAHSKEHSIEVMLPFLQKILKKEFSLTPILCTKMNPVIIGEMISRFLKNERTLIIASSDLSHYKDYYNARVIDRETSNLILSMDYKQITENMTCGRAAVRGLLVAAQKEKMHIDLVDLRNSADIVQADYDKVVGYGSFLFY